MSLLLRSGKTYSHVQHIKCYKPCVIRCWLLFVLNYNADDLFLSAKTKWRSLVMTSQGDDCYFFYYSTCAKVSNRYSEWGKQLKWGSKK